MKSIPIITVLFLLCILAFLPANGQLMPTVKKAVYFDKTPPLREMKLYEPGPRDRSWKDGIIRNEDSDRKFNDNPNPLPNGPDPVWQKEFGVRHNGEMIANFEGIPNLNQVYPPDTDGDVGPDHYFQMINLSFQVFDKEGNSLYGPADNRTLWTGFIGPWTGTNDGDPIILYDEEADRWVATQFAIHTQDGTFWELIALSETGDPLGSYYRYAFEFPTFNDYPKMGVWPDGYYFSFNMFGDDYRRGAVCALERDAMLAGDPEARMILFDLPEGSEPWSLLPADFDGDAPDEGTPNYFAYAMDDAFGGGDYICIYEFKADWETPENSIFEESDRLFTEPFNSHFCNASLGACLPQPDGGPNLEALSDRLMYRLQYRNFFDYEVMVTNHTVNVDNNGHAGIRWYEFRNNKDGNGWFIYQQGTYAPDDHHRWMGSIAMNMKGFIALGFSIVSPTQYPSIHYTGRTPNDPLGEMTFYEEEIMASTGVQTGSAARWGDYSMMSVDPVDDTTFWFTTEYVKQTGSVSWRTRIAGFTMVEDNIAPAPVADLTASENTTNSVTLQWTASGDDINEGTAFLYDIRYSTEPITVDNFENAVQVEDSPDPSIAGTVETFIVDGLDFSTAFYFALKVRDRQFNYSGMSNVVEAATPGAPVIMLDENPLLQKIFPGSSGDRDYTIRNTGASDLYYVIHKDTMGSSLPGGNRPAGEILAMYTGSAPAISGIAWANGKLFMTDMEKDYLLVYDTALQMLTDTVVIHNNPFSIAWNGEYLWISNNTGQVSAYTLDGTAAGLSFMLPLQGYSSLTWNGTCFATTNLTDINPIVYLVDQEGQVLDWFKAMIGGMKIWQIAHVEEHFNGEYWFTNNSGKIGQIVIDEEGYGQMVQQFTAPAGSSYALAHDGKDLWYGKMGGFLYRVEDGIDEVTWIQASPKQGVIPASSQHNIAFYFNAADFDLGSQYAKIIVLSNDPQLPGITVPVELQVTGFALGPDTTFCGHLSITLDAGDGFAGYSWSDGTQGQTLQLDSAGYGVGEQVIWVDVTDIGGTVKRDSILVNFLDCASIFEFSQGIKVTIFPNPSKGIFEVSAENLTDDLEIIITDMAGKTVLKQTIKATDGGGTTSQVDLTGHLTGPYLMTLATGGKIKVEKLLVY